MVEHQSMDFESLDYDSCKNSDFVSVPHLSHIQEGEPFFFFCIVVLPKDHSFQVLMTLT